MRLPSTAHRGLAALALAASALVLGACAHSDPLHSDTEGDYVRVGHLKYQVQLSRQLNPASPSDTQLLEGLSPADATLKPTQAWFAVWVRVENPSPSTWDSALRFTVTDTQGKSYTPTVPAATNDFVYRAVRVAPNAQIPDPSSHAANSPPQGAALLFKLDIASYDNRPLSLAITDDQSGQTGTVQLDV